MPIIVPIIVPIIPIMTYNPLWRFQKSSLCKKLSGRAILSWPRHLQSSKALAIARQLNEAVHSLRGEIFVSRCIKIWLFCFSRIRFSTRWCVSVYISNLYFLSTWSSHSCSLPGVARHVSCVSTSDSLGDLDVSVESGEEREQRPEASQGLRTVP